MVIKRFFNVIDSIFLGRRLRSCETDIRILKEETNRQLSDMKNAASSADEGSRQHVAIRLDQIAEAKRREAFGTK